MNVARAIDLEDTEGLIAADRGALLRAVGKRCWYETSSNGMASQIHC